MISYSLVIVDHPPFDEWVIKKVNYYDMDLFTGHVKAVHFEGNSIHHMVGVQLDRSSLSNTRECATDI